MIAADFIASSPPYEPMHPIGVAMCVLGGLFAILGGVRNWDWFFSFSPAPLFVRIFGRNGARVFYVLLGLFIVIGGILAGLGLIQ
jgi:hypothetical protein